MTALLTESLALELTLHHSVCMCARAYTAKYLKHDCAIRAAVPLLPGYDFNTCPESCCAGLHFLMAVKCNH